MHPDSYYLCPMSPLFIFQILAVVMPQIFSDHMVLQQGRSVPVWGEAAPKEQIVVTLLPEEGGRRALALEP